MRVKVSNYLIAAAVIFVVIGCGSSRIGGVFSPESSKTLLVAVDRSKSMYLNDPDRLGPESMQAMLAMAAPGANFGVMAYSEKAEEVVPLVSLITKEDRKKISEIISKLTLKGKTDFEVAFQSGGNLFGKKTAPEGSSLVLLTDGQHNSGEVDTILAAARGFEERKWKINALAVTPSRRLALLNKVTGETGGKSYRVVNAREGIDASLQIAADAEKMFAFLGDYRTLAVLPGTQNMLVIAMKQSADTGFVSMLPLAQESGGQAVTRNDPNIYAYPEQPGTGSPFDIVNIMEPVAGLYEITNQGAAECSYILCNLPVSVYFVEGSLKDVYDKGELVKVTVAVDTANTELYEMIKASGTVQILAEPKGPGSRMEKVLELTELEANGSTSLIFSGDLPLFSGGSEPVEFKLTATFALNCAHDGVWLQKKRASIKVAPGGSVITAMPSEIDFGHHWSDEEQIQNQFEVSSLYDGLVSISLSELPDIFTATPVTFEASGELKQEVVVQLDPSKATEFGAGEYALVLGNTFVDTGDKGPDVQVAIKAGIYKLDAPEEIKLMAHPGKEISEVIQVGSDPLLKFNYEIGKLSSDVLEIEAGVALKEDGSSAISIAVPFDTQDGIYEGELTATPEIEGLAPRKIKIILSVSGTPQISFTPEELSFSTDKSGWVEETVTIQVEHYEETQLKTQMKNIEAQAANVLISGLYDAEFVPLDEWDGNKVQPGNKYKAKIRYYIASDLQSGSYTGEVEFTVTYRGDNKITAKLPVSVELSR